MQGSGACWPGPQGLAAAAAEMLERRGNKKLKTWLAGRGLGARAPGLGARPTRGVGPFPHKTTQITIFRKPPGGSLAKAWVSAETAASEVGTWRETKPGYPPYPPPPRFGADFMTYTAQKAHLRAHSSRRYIP